MKNGRLSSSGFRVPNSGLSATCQGTARREPRPTTRGVGRAGKGQGGRSRVKALWGKPEAEGENRRMSNEGKSQTGSNPVKAGQTNLFFRQRPWRASQAVIERGFFLFHERVDGHDGG